MALAPRHPHFLLLLLLFSSSSLYFARKVVILAREVTARPLAPWHLPLFSSCCSSSLSVAEHPFPLSLPPPLKLAQSGLAVEMADVPVHSLVPKPLQARDAYNASKCYILRV